MVSDYKGEIAADSEHGVFADDTRFLSYYAIFANGLPWNLLTSSATTYYACRIYLTNFRIETEGGLIPEGTLALALQRSIASGIHEDLDITNHNLFAVQFNLEIALRADFADLFEVRNRKFIRRGRIESTWDAEGAELRNTYRNGEFYRSFSYRVPRKSSPAIYANGRITFEIRLDPGQTWHACCHYVLTGEGKVREPMRTCDVHRKTQFDDLQQQWMEQATRITTSNEDVYRLYRQSVEDMGALRLHEHDVSSNIWIPAAGVPWFVAVFGRDSLIVSLQNMMVNDGFALGTLQKLAELQATEIDDWRDAQPGKIPHEMRYGELAHLKKIPHTPYYGTADATILYPIVLHEAWKWLGNRELLQTYRDVAVRCLDWIDRFGDMDQDGFQEYRTRSSLGYENMGWKDSGDAVVYHDGSQVRPPKGLCELQGYVFDAWTRMAEVFQELGEADRAAELLRKAEDLRQRFEERFWCEDIGFYAYTLDAEKKPVRTIASNAGHCLWSGIASPERAARVVERLMRPDMWSGWGIRTLSSENPAYNPFSYQLGSVWPHDNGIIAQGFRRYGFVEEAARIARDISEAASYFVSYRLPELYAGIAREPGMFPVLYPAANVPQAWAAGSIFHLLAAILGLRAEAPRGKLYLDPRLPSWLKDITLHNLSVGRTTATIRFWREEEQTRWEVVEKRGELAIEQDGLSL